MMGYIILLIVFCAALLASFISKKTSGSLKRFLMETASYFIIFYGLCSFAKGLIGYKSYTLLQSFTDAGIRTVIIYTAALLVYASALIFIRTKTDRVITRDFIFWFFPFFFCALALMGSMTNFVFCICLAAAVFCDFIFSSRDKLTATPKKKLLFILFLAALFFGMTFILYVPSGIILSSLTEIPVKYSWILPVSLGYCACCIILLFFAGWLLPAFFCELYIMLLFSITLSGYLQSNFLNGSLSLMDGKIQAFSSGKIFLNLFIWIAITSAFLVLLGKKKEWALHAAAFISILFFGTQLTSIVVLWLTTDYTVQQTDATLTRDYMTTFDEKNNVLVLMLDWFDGQIMDDIEAQEPDFLNPLKDFTDYDNATSCYGFTYMSIPYLISGVEWQNGMSEKDYMTYANENGTFLSRLNEMGCDIQLYTDPAIIHPEFGKYVQNYSSDVTYKYDAALFLKFWNKCARYNILPFAAKKDYIYTSGDLDSVILSNNIYRCSNDTLVYHDVVRGVSINKGSGGQFKMIHLFGAHHPYRVTKDYEFIEDGNISRNEQAKASFGIAFEYIDQLKKAGIYDDTAIIITADHGQNYFNDLSELEKDGLRPTSSPILFVKMAGETHEALVRSSAPVSHEDFIPTVLKALGDPSYSTFGQSFDEIDSMEDRTRYFIYGRTPDIPFVKYIINGNVMDEASWSLEEIQP